nr:DEAD/DEAH box helicase [Promineifilum sp.]
MSLHPLQTTALLREGYERYLKTIYPFQDAQLRQRFREALGEEGRLVKGPLLEASPPYRPGAALADLVAEGVIAAGFAKLCEMNDALPYRRPLYAHQERAARRAAAGHNLIVATGTGSGKTEAFLIPILDHLLREQAAGTPAAPGVRALLLYPMNALANDQMDRLRRLLARFPAITFGRYTGETGHTRDQALDAYLQRQGAGGRDPQPPPPNELLSRDEMRRTPPHLLLTNYAMLEYLLLRPQDTELFDGPTGGHWRFIVVDEAHVYDGAQGIEVGMLLRRLKERVLRPGQPRLRCIATSATLGGDEMRGDAAAFAAELFGEPFVADDVIAAERLPVAALGAVWGLGGAALYAGLAALPPTSGPADVAAIAAANGAAEPPVAAARAAPDEAAALYALLAGDERLRRLRDALAEPRLLTDVAPLVFDELPPAAAREATVHLVDAAVRARAAGDDAPLLPARYHVFARATEGAFACLNESGHNPPGPRLWLNRHETCPECAAAVFELATCARCGAAYVVGQLVEHDLPDERVDRLQPLRDDVAQGSGRRAYFILAPTLPEANEDDLDEAGAEAADEKWREYTLCLRCGVVAEGQRPPACGHNVYLPVRQANFHHDNDAKMACAKCQTRSKGIVYRLLTGQDAPVSVLATQLYAQLPPADDPALAGRLGQGRKLLIFADSRQDAAFLAPYLERTGRNLLYRRLILPMMLEDGDAASGELRLDSLADILQSRAVAAGAIDPHADLRARRMTTRQWLTREMVATDLNQSLEGLGLLRFELTRPAGWAVPAPLLAAPWNLSAGEAWTLIGLLLDTVRRRGGMRYPEGIDPANDFFAPRNRAVYLSSRVPEPAARGREALQGWLPRQGANTRTDLLEKLLARGAPELSPPQRRAAAVALLARLWEELRGGPWARLWTMTTLHPTGPVYQLSYDAWQWAATTADAPVWRCDHCRSLTPHNLRGLCPVYGCDGALEPMSEADLSGADHHYRYLYRRLPPAYMEVEEHTAQWTSDKAAEIQQRFIDGRVNVLSCSTTFELGVDVGAL